MMCGRCLWGWYEATAMFSSPLLRHGVNVEGWAEGVRELSWRCSDAAYSLLTLEVRATSVVVHLCKWWGSVGTLARLAPHYKSCTIAVKYTEKWADGV